MRHIVCPLCSQEGITNHLGDPDRDYRETHPYISKSGYRICKNKWSSIHRTHRLGVLDEDYEEIRI